MVATQCGRIVGSRLNLSTRSRPYPHQSKARRLAMGCLYSGLALSVFLNQPSCRCRLSNLGFLHAVLSPASRLDIVGVRLRSRGRQDGVADQGRSRYKDAEEVQGRAALHLECLRGDQRGCKAGHRHRTAMRIRAVRQRRRKAHACPSDPFPKVLRVHFIWIRGSSCCKNSTFDIV